MTGRDMRPMPPRDPPMTAEDVLSGAARWALNVADCRAAMATLGDATIDAVVCDPPYELGFMGRAWDASGIAYDVAMWREVLRVLKPGGHLLAFGGTRTYHRMTCAIEDAGFEVRDCLAWMYGSGFPKSLDVSKAIDKAAGMSTDAARAWSGFGTALKPAFEPVVMARKRLTGTVAANVLAHGTGAINVDGCRIGTSKSVPASAPKDRPAQIAKGAGRGRTMDTTGFDHNIGRWPANVLLDEEAARMLDEQSGTLTSSFAGGVLNRGATTGSGMGYASSSSSSVVAPGYGDSGGASRFFYTAKASTSERERGLEHRARRKVNDGREAGGAGNDNPRLRGETPRANIHPTVKPIDLMRWLVRLVTPPGGVVLDPFAGSGTTLIAALAEGMRAIGFEMDEEHASIARDRIVGDAPLLNGTARP